MAGEEREDETKRGRAGRKEGRKRKSIIGREKGNGMKKREIEMTRKGKER